MKSILLLTFLIISLHGCGKDETIQKDEAEIRKEIEFSRKVIGAEFKRGMFSVSNDSAKFNECGSEKTYALEGDTEELKKLYSKYSGKLPSGKAYIEIESFRSTKSPDSESISDTVFVVTKFIKFDANINCN
ncbi:MAG: hypothetical protein IPM38_12830 [Ignavibacteria bacterium]|nr:hypothetical protein [Ignavibacteria bacterium]